MKQFIILLTVCLSLKGISQSTHLNPKEIYAKVELNNKWGVINGVGEEITSIKYDKIRDFKEGMAVVVTEGKCGYINYKGEVIVESKYEDADDFSNGLAVVKNNKGFGVINKKGVLVIPCGYLFIGRFVEELAIVKEYTDGGVKFGIIDKEGKKVIESKYDKIFQYHNGLARVKLNDKYGFFDSKGELVIPIVYNGGKDFSEGLAAVSNDSKYGFVNKKNEIIIPFKYKEVENFSDGYAKVQFKNKYVYIDKAGNKLIKQSYNFHVEPFSEELAVVHLSIRGDGFINRKGKIVIKPKYNEATEFNEGSALVKINKGYHLIDKQGNIIQNYNYIAMFNFKEGLAPVMGHNKKCGYINKKNEIIIPLIYESVKSFSYGLAFVKLGGKWGVINSTHQTIVTPKYDSVNFFMLDSDRPKENE